METYIQNYTKIATTVYTDTINYIQGVQKKTGPERCFQNSVRM